jgi:hypothetical protein
MVKFRTNTAIIQDATGCQYVVGASIPGVKVETHDECEVQDRFGHGTYRPARAYLAHPDGSRSYIELGFWILTFADGHQEAWEPAALEAEWDRVD